MIKVNKNLNDVPTSLNDRKTNRKRDNCIKDKKYHYKKAFDQQYKQPDVKKSLKDIYNKKCAFCEQKIIECIDNNLEDCSQTIEHYRPKGKYYWLAFSWDNLLLCCYRCNQNKDNKFEIINNLEIFNKNTFLKKIHKIVKIYNRIEKPKMIHPELENILNKLSFKNGIINSNDERVKYTINNCGLDRDELNDKRQTIIDDFIESIIDKKLKNESIIDILKDLISDFKNPDNEFRALRYWILKNHSKLI